jgi:general secretion pathway protein B
MSFILDALRKSEHERQRQLGPSIAELPVARPSPRVPAWVWITLAGLLALNVAVVAWFLVREPAAPPPLPASAAPEAAAAPAAAVPLAAAPAVSSVAAAPTPAGPAAQPDPAAEEPAREVRPLMAEAVAPPPEDAPVFAAPEAPDPALLPAAPRPVVPPAPRAAPVVAAGVPSIEQLPAQTTAGLPPLNLDLHIYASQPAQRAVFINGARYREGDALPGGARVQEITPDGAILFYGGQRFLLPRQ